VHEMGITAEILAAVTDATEKAGGTRINSVHVTIGELTEIVPDAIQFAWEALTPGTLAEGATLEIVRTEGRSRCLQCGAEFSHDRWDRICAACGSFLTEPLSGDELRVDSVDIDTPEDGAAATPPVATGSEDVAAAPSPATTATAGED
jgi:hydrogenase nickel incorporation protein HypA/HybF